MRSILTLILTLFSSLGIAQKLVTLDGKIGLLDIDNGDTLNIKTKYHSGANKGLASQFQFINEEGEIRSRLNNSIDFSNDSFSLSMFGLWPNMIKIKNNGFLLQIEPNDSLVYDNHSRIVLAIQKDGDKSSIRKAVIRENIFVDSFHIFQLERLDGDSSGTLYMFRLDHNSNIVAESHASNFRYSAFSNRRFNDVAWDESLEYDYVKTKLAKILFFTYNKGRKLIGIQSFVYSNGHVRASNYINMRTKSVEYTQQYYLSKLSL